MDILRDFRKRHNFTQSQACKELGYGFPIWGRYERGERKIPRHVYLHIVLYDEVRDAKK